jgi:hypothetical protein
MTTVKAWLAWARTGPSYKSWDTPVDHGTVDGKRTLCGVAELGGHDPSVPFADRGARPCRRCARIVARHGQFDVPAAIAKATGHTEDR